jgi:2,4-dienoyl-CoA reductase (NADPH2)
MNGSSSSPDPVFTPLSFRNLTVKNRVFRSSISGRLDNEDGSLTQAHLNWESKFAAGGVGAIISSYVPVVMEGRIMAGYATIDRDDLIPQWRKVGELVHSYDCKYILQLSHAGRQMDLPGVHNTGRISPSATERKEPVHGFPARAMSEADIARTVSAFADAAWRAREAGLDGIELHACNGYLFTQFLSSAINDRSDAYGGSLENRARFLLEVIAAIRARVGRDFHLQVKLAAADHANLVPWEIAGNTISDTIQVAQWCEKAGVDAIHVSIGSMFPHPLNPPGGLPFDELAITYDAMISSGSFGLRNYLFFRYRALRPLFRWAWFRMKAGRPVEGVSLADARAIKAAISIPVISTGGFQSASVVREAISRGAVDAVSIARALVANNDLVRQWEAGADLPKVPCTHCNRCLVNAVKNPVGCYDRSRYPSREAMVEAIMSIYATQPEFNSPRPLLTH